MSKIKVMWLHEFMRAVKEEFLRTNTYLCYCAEHKFGEGADRAMMALVRERYPMWDYVTVTSCQRLENGDFDLDLDTDFTRARLIFIEQLLAQPDRRICWVGA